MAQIPLSSSEALRTAPEAAPRVLTWTAAKSGISWICLRCGHLLLYALLPCFIALHHHLVTRAYIPSRAAQVRPKERTTICPRIKKPTKNGPGNAQYAKTPSRHPGTTRLKQPSTSQQRAMAKRRSATTVAFGRKKPLPPGLILIKTPGIMTSVYLVLILSAPFTHQPSNQRCTGDRAQESLVKTTLNAQ